jgi:hypothetical protein
MQRHALPVVLVAAIIAVAADAAALAASDPAPAPATYTARGFLEVNPLATLPARGGGTAPGVIPPEYYNVKVDMAVLELKSTRVLQMALDKLKADGKPSYYESPTAVTKLAQDLRAERIGNTFEIMVSLSGPDKVKVQELLRAVLEQFVKVHSEVAGELHAKRLTAITDEQRILAKQVDRMQTDLTKYRDAANVTTTDPASSAEMLRLQIFTRRLTETQIALDQASSEWQSFQEVRKAIEGEKKDATEVLMAFPEVLDQLNSDVGIRVLTDEIARMGRELAVAKETGKTKDAIKTMEATIAVAKRDLEDRRSLALGTAFQQEAATLKTRFNRLRAAETDLLTRVAEARTIAIGMARMAEQYENLATDLKRVRSLLDTVNTRLEEMRIQAATAEPEVRIMAMPEVPLRPDPPKGSNQKTETAMAR